MPLTSFDYSWDVLQTYTGLNPRPADFDAFWDAALAEMHALGTQTELVPVEFQAPNAECFHLYFTGVGGALVHAKYLRPKNAPTRHPGVVMFHGYSGNSGDWSDKLNYVSAGFSVAALDCRGQGGLSQDIGSVSGNTYSGHIIRGLDEALHGRPEKLLFRQIFLDTAQLARILMAMPEVDPQRVGATGGSQGGALTVACASLEPGIRRVAPVFPFLSDYQRVWGMDQAKGRFASRPARLLVPVVALPHHRPRWSPPSPPCCTSAGGRGIASGHSHSSAPLRDRAIRVPPSPRRSLGMPLFTRVVAAGLVVLVAVQATGCTSWKTVPLPPPSAVAQHSGRKVQVILQDKRTDGSFRRFDADSATTDAIALIAYRGYTVDTIPLAAVKAVKVRQSSPWKTAALATFIVILALIAQYGRTTDIENIVEVDVSDTGTLLEVRFGPTRAARLPSSTARISAPIRCCARRHKTG